MRKIIIILSLITLAHLYGCKSINVGGSGQTGTVTGSGQITVSIPEQNK